MSSIHRKERELNDLLSPEKYTKLRGTHMRGTCKTDNFCLILPLSECIPKFSESFRRYIYLLFDKYYPFQ